MRRRILIAFERAEDTEDANERRQLLTFVIIGGGPTGVELAGALAELARMALARDFRHIDPKTARIILIEAGPRVLATFPSRLSHFAGQALRRLGVEVRVGAAVTDCDKDGVSLGDERIESRTGNGLKTIEEATTMRRRILIAFERAEDTEDANERRQLLTFVIIGGGPTGVELAGALAELARMALARDFRHIDPKTARIILIEAGPRVLATFPSRLSHFAGQALRRLGVEVRVGRR